jgi:hypothetical protein
MAAAFAATRLILATRHVARRRPVAASASVAKDDGDGGDRGGEDDSRLRNVKALLGADARAFKQVLNSPEGKAMVAMDLHVVARRIVKLRDALPVPDIEVMAMVGLYKLN